MENRTIFDLTKINYIYKGVFFAELDTKETAEEIGCPKPPADYVVGIMGIIYVDEEGYWNVKFRIKYPSGNKQVLGRRYDGHKVKDRKINETFILQDVYKIPMINKRWTANPSGKPEGIVEIIQKLDMIESFRFIEGGIDGNI